MAKSTRRKAKPFGLYERQLAFRYLGAKRSQGGVGAMAVISFLGIMAAVFVLIVTMSIMNGFRQTLLSRIIGTSGHIAIDVRGRSPAELDEVIRRVLETPEVVRATPLVTGQTLASLGSTATGALVFGISKEALQRLELISGNLQQGSLLNFRTDEDGQAEIVIGERLANQLGVGVGDPLTLIAPQGQATVAGLVPRRKTYTIGATFNAGFFLADSSFIYMPLQESQLFFGRDDTVDVLEVRLEDAERSEQVMQALRPKLGPTIYLSDWKQQNREYVTALIVERVAMRIILMVVVTIAALNIISGLVMLVRNKARDVAILRTMGASRNSILRVFLLAGGLLGAAGTLAGVGLAVVFLLNIGAIQSALEFVTGTQVFDASVYQLSRVPAAIEPLEVIGVSAFAIGMSFVAALLPARAAARLDPVEALRYE